MKSINVATPPYKESLTGLLGGILMIVILLALCQQLSIPLIECTEFPSVSKKAAYQPIEQSLCRLGTRKQN